MLKIPGYCDIIALKTSHYNSNNALAVIAVTKWPDGEVDHSQVSVNLDHEGNAHASCALASDEFYAKSYSEGEAIHKALVKAGWIVLTGKLAQSGFVTVPVCKIGPNAVVETE